VSTAPRTGWQRRQDAEQRLAQDVDLWVASCSADGAPYLIPLSFNWDGETLLLATPTDSSTGRVDAGRSLAGLTAPQPPALALTDSSERDLP